MNISSLCNHADILLLFLQKKSIYLPFFGEKSKCKHLIICFIFFYIEEFMTSGWIHSSRQKKEFSSSLTYENNSFISLLKGLVNP